MLYNRSALKNVLKFTDKHKKQSSSGVLPKEQNSQKNIFPGVSFLNKLAGWKPEMFRSSHWIFSVEQGALKGALSGLRQCLVNEGPLK